VTFQARAARDVVRSAAMSALPMSGHAGTAAGPNRGGVTCEFGPPVQHDGDQPDGQGGGGEGAEGQESGRKGDGHHGGGLDAHPCASVSAPEVSEFVFEDRRQVLGVVGMEPVGAKPQVPAPAVAGRAGVREAVPVTGQRERYPFESVPGGEGVHVVLGLPHTRGHRQVERRRIDRLSVRADERVPGQCLGEGA
jgi:hypothetical protein